MCSPDSIIQGPVYIIPFVIEILTEVAHNLLKTPLKMWKTHFIIRNINYFLITFYTMESAYRKKLTDS